MLSVNFNKIWSLDSEIFKANFDIQTDNKSLHVPELKRGIRGVCVCIRMLMLRVLVILLSVKSVRNLY